MKTAGGKERILFGAILVTTMAGLDVQGVLLPHSSDRDKS